MIQTWVGGVLILAGIVLFGFLLAKLSPVILPFALAFAIAYLTDPLLELLSRRLKIPRLMGIVVVFILLFCVIAIALFYFVPALIHQFANLSDFFPVIIDWLQNNLQSFMTRFGLENIDINWASVKETLGAQVKEATKAASWLGSVLYRSGMSFAGGIMQFLIVLVATFYLLRDWPNLLSQGRNLIPAPYQAKTLEILNQCDEVLSAFIRGQLIVMAILALFYMLGLSLIGIHFSLLMGFIIGLLSIVPYLGSILGFAIALIAVLIQFHTWVPVAEVVALFAFGHILEGMILTPYLIGDKLGLHPVAVIFAILAGGHLMGMVGVILALPVAAILMVLIRAFYQSKLKPK